MLEQSVNAKRIPEEIRQASKSETFLLCCTSLLAMALHSCLHSIGLLSSPSPLVVPAAAFVHHVIVVTNTMPTSQLR